LTVSPDQGDQKDAFDADIDVAIDVLDQDLFDDLEEIEGEKT